MTDYQLRARNPAGTMTTTTAMGAEQALRHALEMRNTRHTEIVLINLDTGDELPIGQFMNNPGPPDA